MDSYSPEAFVSTAYENKNSTNARLRTTNSPIAKVKNNIEIHELFLA